MIQTKSKPGFLDLLMALTVLPVLLEVVPPKASSVTGKKRTLRDALNELHEPHRSRALKNADAAKIDLEYRYPAFSALGEAFKWEKSPEGHDYWKGIYARYEKAYFSSQPVAEDEEVSALDEVEKEKAAAGRLTFIDFTLRVPSHWSVAEAHAHCDRIEEALLAELGEASINIHLEPLTD